MLFNLGILSIFFFMYLQDTLTDENKEFRFLRRGEQSPLGVIWHQSNSSLELATPEEYTKQKSYLRYVFDKSKGEIFFAACPSSTISNQLELVNIDPHEKNYYDSKCKHQFKRTLENLKDECANESEAELFGVGYYISIKTNEEVRFLEVYKICRINGKTHFTIHDVDPIDEINYLTKNQSAYRFVPSLDMPTHTQQITTEEAMNTMPLSTEGQMDSTSELEIYLDYLNKVDEAIRNFVKNFGYRTKIYTGLRATSEERKTCKYIFKVLKYVENSGQPVSFAVITRFHSSKECTNVCNDISEKIKDFHFPQKTRNPLKRVKNYVHGFNFLTYACEVDMDVIIKFGLNNYIRSAMKIPSFHRKQTTEITKWVFKRDKKSPLAVIRHQSDSFLEPAIPEEYENKSYLRYVFDESKGGTFFAACPISSESNELKPVDINRYEADYYDFKCDHEFKHISENLDEQCANESAAQLFGVGYYVFEEINNEGKRPEFMDVYNICRIDERTHFTMHDVAPISEENYLTENEPVYRFVPSLDMPTHTLQITTEEVMNTMPLSTEGQMDSTSELKIYLDYLNKVDKDIRDFVRKLGYKTRIYTGLRTTTEERKTCKYIFKVLRYTKNGSQFNGFAIITRFDSSNECTNVCEDISEKIKDFNFYREENNLPNDLKAFTYGCEVNEDVIIKFGLNNYIRSAMKIPSFHRKQPNTGGYSDKAEVTSMSNMNNNNDDADSEAGGLMMAAAIPVIADLGHNGSEGVCDGVGE